MKSLILYDSKFGNTQKIAEIVAGGLRASGEVVTRRVEDGAAELDQFDLIVVGAPTQGHTASKPMNELLDSIPRGSVKHARGAAFDTRFHIPEVLSGSGAKAIARRLRRAGVDMIVPATSFFVEKSEGPLRSGEEDRASDWAITLTEATAREPVAPSV